MAWAQVISDVNDNVLLFNFFKYIDVFGEKIEKLQPWARHLFRRTENIKYSEFRLIRIIWIVIVLSSYGVKITFDKIHIAAPSKSNG